MSKHIRFMTSNDETRDPRGSGRGGRRGQGPQGSQGGSSRGERQHGQHHRRDMPYGYRDSSDRFEAQARGGSRPSYGPDQPEGYAYGRPHHHGRGHRPEDFAAEGFKAGSYDEPRFRDGGFDPTAFEAAGFGPGGFDTESRGPRPPFQGGPRSAGPGQRGSQGQRGSRSGRGPWGQRPDAPFGADEQGAAEFGGRGGHGHGPGQRGEGQRGPGQRGHGRRGRGRGGKGDVRAAVLNLLNEEPRTGYQLMGAIEEKSQGLWKPGAGSIYPALQLLADEGLITLDSTEGGRKTYSITDEGRSYLAEHPDKTKAPWDRVTSDIKGMLNLRPELEQLHAAVDQVVKVATDDQQSRAKEILVKARKDLYKILAEDESSAEGAAADEAASDESSADEGSAHESSADHDQTQE